MGACCDIGAGRTVIGLQQARAYCREQGMLFKLRASDYSFLFGDRLYISLGNMDIHLPTPDGAFLTFQADVADADIPLLLGIDVLDAECMVAENVENVLDHRKRNWRLPITRRGKHMYVVWNVSHVMYSRAQLKKMHMHFFHPSAQKLFNLLKRIDPEQTTPETLDLLKQISKACSTCTVHSSAPHRFRVSLPEDLCVFNHELALDLMWLDSNPVLHVVDTHTLFLRHIIARQVYTGRLERIHCMLGINVPRLPRQVQG